MADNALRIVSHFPGRLRVRAVPFRDPARGDDVADKVRGEDGVLSAAATSLTGSLLVEYDARKVQLPWLVQLIVKLGGLDGLEVDHDGRPLAPQGPAIRGALDRWNAALVAASRGRLDAKTAVPGTLAGLGALALLLGPRSVPRWYDLFFWSFVTFVNLNPAALDADARVDGEAGGR
jgi:hypothetical protein